MSFARLPLVIAFGNYLLVIFGEVPLNISDSYRLFSNKRLLRKKQNRSNFKDAADGVVVEAEVVVEDLAAVGETVVDVGEMVAAVGAGEMVAAVGETVVAVEAGVEVEAEAVGEVNSKISPVCSR
jgi:hypothetical protein